MRDQFTRITKKRYSIIKYLSFSTNAHLDIYSQKYSAAFMPNCAIISNICTSTKKRERERWARGGEGGRDKGKKIKHNTGMNWTLASSVSYCKQNASKLSKRLSAFTQTNHITMLFACVYQRSQSHSILNPHSDRIDERKVCPNPISFTMARIIVVNIVF